MIEYRVTPVTHYGKSVHDTIRPVVGESGRWSSWLLSERYILDILAQGGTVVVESRTDEAWEGDE